MSIEGITLRRLNRCKVHPVSRARSDQARAAHMHFPDRVRHLRDGRYVLDDEPLRQESLIDQLYDPFVRRIQPDRPKMFSAYFHVCASAILHLPLHQIFAVTSMYGNRFIWFQMFQGGCAGRNIYFLTGVLTHPISEIIITLSRGIPPMANFHYRVL